MTIFKIRKNIINNLLKKMASRSFLVFCFLLLVFAVISAGFFLYCQAVFVGSGGDTGESQPQVKKFNDATAKNVFEIWKKREQDFKDADSISYPDTFRTVVID